MNAEAQRVAQDILDYLDKQVRSLPHAVYREVLDDLLSSLELREQAAKEEAESE